MFWLPLRVSLRAGGPALRRLPRTCLGLGLGTGLGAVLTGAWPALLAREHGFSQEVPEVTEPKSGLTFPAWQHEDQLLGTGCQVQYGVWTQYALALYLSPAGKKELSRYLAFSPSQWDRRFNEVLRSLVTGTFRKSLVLKMCRQTAASTLLKEWEDAMAAAGIPVEPDHWATLSQALLQRGPALPKGSELQLTAEGDRLQVSLNGNPVGEVAGGPQLCQAVFEVYLGQHQGPSAFRLAVKNGFVSWART
eukprot:EG_transcript_25116